MLKNNEITILSLHLGYGGIEQYLSSLCSLLDSKYKINLIVTYKLSNKPAFYFSDKVNITYLINRGPNKEEFKDAFRKKNIIKIFKEGFISIKLLYLKRKKNIKAIKNIDSKYIITTRSFHNRLVGKYAPKECIKIATEHNYHDNNLKYVNDVVSSVKNFNYFVLVSEELKNYYEKIVSGPKCIYIPNIIDKLPNKKSLLNMNNLITIGRMEAVKGFDDLIDIIKLVKEKVPSVKLFMIGDGSLKKSLENKVKENDLEDNIIFTGFLSKDEMDKYFLKSKLYVMTSHSESFGLVLLEAMSYGIPCIAFDSASGPCNLLKNDVGILVKNRNKEEMANIIVKLFNSQKEIEKMSKSSLNYVKNYLPESVKTQWFNILDK